jgi:diaminopimelate decarboxylase
MKKDKYIAPNIELIQISSIGKHSILNMNTSSVFEEVEDVEKLMEENGSPLWLLSEKTLREKYREFKNAFTEEGIETIIGYSYKTNYLPAVCSILKEEGAYAEVVADMEYKLARSLNVPGSEIIFNGCYKTRSELSKAVSDGALINIDNFDEIELLDDVARNLGKNARVGIRVNFIMGNSSWTKFGFNYETKQAEEALRKISKKKYLNFEAIHNHSGTFNIDPKIYSKATRIIIELVGYANKIGLKTKIIDIGGGFPSSNKLKPEYDIPGGSKYNDETLKSFASVVMRALKKSKHLFNNGKPILVLEPGRAVVDECMQLVSKITSKKKDPDGGTNIVIDAGVNVLPTAYWYNFEPKIANKTNGIKKNGTNGSHKTNHNSDNNGPVKIYGPLCMQIDSINDSVNLTSTNVGDTLVFSNVGAYNLTQSMQFIQTRPAVILLGPKGSELIRRKESWRDVFSLDSVPKRLSSKSNGKY